jgi:hypothetical protein
LILAATLLFLVFASWAMLSTAGITLHSRPIDPDLVPHEPSPGKSPIGSRRGRILGTFGILLGLLGSLGLFVLCAF